jgi:hypothetical protein
MFDEFNLMVKKFCYPDMGWLRKKPRGDAEVFSQPQPPKRGELAKLCHCHRNLMKERRRYTGLVLSGLNGVQ